MKHSLSILAAMGVAGTLWASATVPTKFQAQDYASALTQAVQNPDSLIDRAYKLYNDGKAEEALKLCNLVGVLDPDNINNLNLRGFVYFQLGDTVKCINDMARTHALTLESRLDYSDPQDMLVMLVRERPAEVIGAVSKEITDAKMLPMVEDDDDESNDYLIGGLLLTRGGLQGELRNTEEEVGDYEEAMIFLPDSKSAIYSLIANAYSRARDYENALKAADKGLEISAYSPDCIQAKMLALRNSGKPGEAVEFLESKIEGNPDTDRIYSNIAVVKGGMKDYQGAIEALEKVSPENREVLREGILYAKAGNQEKATELLTSLLTDDPDDIGNAMQLAYLGRADEAVALIEKHPEDSEDWYKAAIYTLAGDREKGVEYLLKAVDDGTYSIDNLPYDINLESLASDPRIKLARVKLQKKK